jgi:hypothetical protein
MKFVTLGVSILFISLFVSPTDADIYSWTDENGVKHFGNVPPPDADEVNVEFKEYQYDEAADRERFEMDQKEWQTIIRELEENEKKAQAEAQAAKRNQPMSRKERIEAEKERLARKITQLEEKPLDEFGSQRNKRATIGYYKYRLQALLEDPKKYFKEPEPFQGNYKSSEGSQSAD